MLDQQYRFRGIVCCNLSRKQNPSRVFVDVEHYLSNTYGIPETQLPYYGTLKHDMKNNEKARCFVLLAKFTGRKYSDEEELKRLHRTNSIRHKNQVTMNVLLQILQVQEVGSTKEYHLNGCLVKAHVLEDTNL